MSPRSESMKMRLTPKSSQPPPKKKRSRSAHSSRRPLCVPRAPTDLTRSCLRDIENRDYLKLSWQRRRVDLDDLRAPDGHVVTGVTFQKLGEHLNMEIQVRKPSATETDRPVWL